MVESVALRQFRSYDDFDRRFESGINLIRGPNGSGKTNLLEAICFGLTGRSFRAGIDGEMIAFGQQWARVEVGAGGHQYVRKLEVEPGADSASATKKTFEFDGERVGRPLTRNLPVVVFEPNQLKVFYSGPSYRRELMDELAQLFEPTHETTMRKYRRTLAQRNAAIKAKLKKNDFSYDDQLFVWDLRLSELAGEIYTRRAAALEVLDQRASQIYSGFAGVDCSLDFTYSTEVLSSEYSSNMLALLSANIERDIARQRTSVGIHRDDLACVLNGNNLLATGSRGEKRTVLLAIKLIAASADLGGAPKLLLLDDLFSELDQTRQQQLEDLLPKLTPQTIATSV